MVLLKYYMTDNAYVFHRLQKMLNFCVYRMYKRQVQFFYAKFRQYVPRKCMNYIPVITLGQRALVSQKRHFPNIFDANFLAPPPTQQTARRTVCVNCWHKLLQKNTQMPGLASFRPGFWQWLKSPGQDSDLGVLFLLTNLVSPRCICNFNLTN